MTISIFKFGGSCLQNAQAFEKIYRIMRLHKDEKMIFVASALQGVTDLLESTAKCASDKVKSEEFIQKIKKKHYDVIDEIFNDGHEFRAELNNFIEFRIEDLRRILSEIKEFGLELYFLDYVLSFGEKMSTYILYLYVKSRGIPAKYLAGEDFLITDSNFGNSLPNWELTKNRITQKMVPAIKDPRNKMIFCITGFIGRNKIGYTTTLGRGGSDFTATIIARILFDQCEDKKVRVVLWKDVDGILATNPKYAKDPKLIRHINYDEAKEMAFYGSKILHPKCLVGLDERHIPVEIRNFDKPEEKDIYSEIGDLSGEDEITGISTIEDVYLLSVSSGSLVSTPGVLSKIFTIMGNNNINVSLVAQSSSEINTTFIVEKSDGELAFNLIIADKFFEGWAEVSLKNVSIIAVTGKGLSNSSIQAKIFESLALENIKIIAMSQSSEGLNLSMVVEKEEVGKAVELLNTCSKCL